MPRDLEPALSFRHAWPAAAKHVTWHDFDLTHIATPHKSRHFAVTWLKTVTRCNQLTGPCYNCAHFGLSARAHANLKGTTGEEASQALSTGTLKKKKTVKKHPSRPPTIFKSIYGQESPNKGVKQHSKDITLTPQQRPELPTVTLTQRAGKYKGHKLRQKYILSQ